MGGSKSRKSKSLGEDWVAEAEPKGQKDMEDVSPLSCTLERKTHKFFQQGSLRGLGALLFDDGKYVFHLVCLLRLSVDCMIAPPPTESREQDVIQKTLNAVGVMYSHHNDEILVPSRIEEERTKKMLVCVVSGSQDQLLMIRRKRDDERQSPHRHTKVRCLPNGHLNGDTTNPP